MTLLLHTDAGVLRQVVARAAPLRERIAVHAASGEGAAAAPDETAQTRLRLWGETVGTRDAGALDRRLAWDGWDLAVVARALGAAPPPAVGPLPGWAATLAAAYGEPGGEAPAGAEADTAVELDPPLPFTELFAPLVRLARERVRDRAPAGYALLEPAAHEALERALLARLASISARALYTDFSVHRACRRQGTAALFAVPGDRRMYEAFSAGLRGAGMWRFFRGYPVAARLCGTVADLWAESTAEFLGRLAADLDEVRTALGGGADPGPVAGLSTSLSDPHEGGRAVVIVRFASGLRVVYKPRPLPLEAVYEGLVAWLNARGARHPLRAVATVRRPTHGWLEFVEQGPCADAAGIERFFHRSGALLFIATLFNGTDFHFENLIAVGEHPVLIDMEGLVGHRYALREQLPTAAMLPEDAVQAFLRSVLSVRMLPTLKTMSDGSAEDVSGLGSGGEAVMGVSPCWVGVGTDDVRVGYQRRPVRPEAKNLPWAGGQRGCAADHVERIADGYREAYRIFLAGRGDWLRPGGMLEGVRGAPARFILRNTSLYGAVLERCLHPRFLRDGADRSIELDALSRSFLGMGAAPEIWPVREDEDLALERMDVPLLQAPAEGVDLPLSTGRVVGGCFETSALREAAERLAALSEADLAHQVETLRAAYAVDAARDVRVSDAAPAPALPAAPGHGADDAGAALAEALRLAEGIAARAVGGGAAWLAASYLPRARRFAYGAAGPHLFDGYGGIGLFLAAAERAGGGGEWGGLARRALRPLAGRVAELESVVRLRRFVDVGAAVGLGGYAYALARAGTLLDDAPLLDAARRVAALVTVAPVSRDDTRDAMSGSAGGVLALLGVHGMLGGDALVAQAAALGDHLLGTAAPDAATGLRVWTPRPHAPPETGFAHGQAGIACALFRLAEATDAPRFADAAAEALAWERGALGPELAGAVAEEGAAAWGRGSTGIGLARLAGVGGADDAAARAEVARALDAARGHLLAGSDTLASGAAARVELLLAAGERLGRPALVAEGLAAARAMMDAAAARGGYRLGWGGLPNPSLFCGSAGVGYALLRAARPGLLPPVLLWA